VAQPLELKSAPTAAAEGAILSKAAYRAAKAMDLRQSDLAAVIGVSNATVSRMKDGRFALSGKPFELATGLVRVFRSLDAIVGGDPAAMKSWMRAPNTALRGTPGNMVQNAFGLMTVLTYLDAQRAPL